MPARLCYRGSVLRSQHERARHDQHALQAGIELVGAGGTAADLEVIAVSVKAVRAAGLADFVLDLGHGGIASALLSKVSSKVRKEIMECLSLKDGAELERRAAAADLPADLRRALAALVTLQGGSEVFTRAAGHLAKTAAWPLIIELKELFDAIAGAGIAAQIVVDLGETRGAAYYTGPTFQILAEGPGQAVVSGGRYDALYGLFGAGRPAAGAAIQLDHLRWALGPSSDDPRWRVIVVDQPGPAAEAAATQLRNEEIPCVFETDVGALDYARAWRYSHIVRPDGALYRVFRVRSEEQVDLGAVPLDQLSMKIRG